MRGMRQTSCQKTTVDGLDLSIQHFIKQSGRSNGKALFMKYNMKSIWNNDHYAELPTKSVNLSLHCLILKKNFCTIFFFNYFYQLSGESRMAWGFRFNKSWEVKLTVILYSAGLVNWGRPKIKRVLRKSNLCCSKLIKKSVNRVFLNLDSQTSLDILSYERINGLGKIHVVERHKNQIE